MASLFASPGFLHVILALPLWFLLLATVDAANMSVDRSEEVSAILNFKDDNLQNFFEGADESDYSVNAYGYWLNWKETDATPCAWIGVTCTENYNVEELDFSEWGLILSNFSSLFNLTDLRRLDLSSNFLFDMDFIGNFTSLTYLDVSGNNWLAGALPHTISLCKNLRFLSLENNYFYALPPSMSDLVNLQVLNLAENSFSGPFPIAEVGNLGSLVRLDLSNNSFNGSIPSLSNLSNLLELNLANNYFTGFDEESSFIAPQSLVQLNVSNNQLGGTIPSSITNLVNLNVLDMSRNNLSGEIPNVVYRLLSHYNLSVLDLSQNQLAGQIPTDMFLQVTSYGCPSVNFSHNLLSGDIHSQVNTFFCFLVLDLSFNSLGGPIPFNIFNASNNVTVSYLYLNDNRFSGDVVDLFLPLSAESIVNSLQVQNNLFTGDLSRIAETYNLADLPVNISFPSVVDLSNNRVQWSTSEAISDPITATLKILTSGVSTFIEFRVGGNNFSGTSLPTECFLNYSGNELAVLDLSNSQLKGEISGAAFNSTCLGPNIQLLNLSNNHATGQLPESIIRAQPQDFIADVSSNDLSGPLPTILPSSSMYNPKYFAGNGGLCGVPLGPCTQNGTVGVHWWVLLIIIGGSVTIATGSCLTAIWRWRVYHKRHQQDADLIKTLLERDSAALMSLRELKKATGNFAESSQIGEGGFGTVYKGTLNDGTTVAIKRSKREGSEHNKQQFLNEVRILSQVNHRNLVKLLGCCMENKVAVLVFEFISNGTLQDRLRKKIGTVCLTWKERLIIAVQTADALNYLHSAASFPIYHRDVKSANILLDDERNAKVADFGISKLVPVQATHVSTAAIQGTLGYIDPEYYTSYQLTDKSDVYSFGVVLLELISGKPALDFSRGGEETSLVHFANSYIERGELEGLIDPALVETYNDKARNERDSIVSVGKLAMQCLDMRSKPRPSMNEVCKELQHLWAQLRDASERLEFSINERENKDLPCTGERALLPSNSKLDSASFGMESDPSGIEMSQFFSCGSFDNHASGRD